MDVFDLSATLSLDTSKYESGLSGALGAARNIGGKIGSALKVATLATGALVAAGAAVTGAFVAGAKKVADYGDNVDKMSQKLGLSTDGFQKWDYVLKIAGTDINSMSTGLKTLTNKLDDAKNGSSDAQKMFEKLGISTEELENMSREEAFEATIKGFQGMADSTERAALANDLFGRSGQNLTPLFNQTAEDTEKQLELAEKYGMVMPEAAVKASAAFEDSLTTMQMTFTGMKNRLMGEFLPAMTMVTDGMGKLFAGDDSGAEDVAEGIEQIIDKMGEVLPKVMEIGGTIAKHLGESFIKSIPDLLSTMADAGIRIGKSVANTLVKSFGSIRADGFANAFGKVIDYLVENVPAMLENLAQALSDNAPMLAENGAEMIIKLGEGLIEALPQLISAAGLIVDGLLKVFVGIPVLLLSKGLEAVGAFVLGILKKANAVATAGAKLVSNFVKGLRNLAGRARTAAGNAVTALISRISSGVGKIKSTAQRLAQNAVNAIKNGFANIGNVGLNLVKGIWNGISNGTNWIKARIKGWVGNIKSFLKNLFGIKSPSRWARDEIGKMIDAGLALGISNNSDMVEDAMEDVLPDVSNGLISKTSSNSNSKIVSPVFNMSLVVNGADDPELWGDKMADEFIMRVRTA